MGTYTIWPSRYNIPAHMSLAMGGIAYIIPTIILPEIISGFNTDIIKLYGDILVIGSISYLLGMIIGYKFESYKKREDGPGWQRVPTDVYCRKVSRLTVILTFFAVGGLIICFCGMGHIPLFAEDPIAAKFHRGIYQVPYKRVSKLFRICHYTLQFTMPILVVLWFYYRKKILYLILILLSLTVMIFCVARGPAFSGFVVGIGIISAYRKFLFKYYLLSLLFIYGIGSSFFYILGITGYRIGSEEDIFKIMVRGAPDVFDHLVFLTAFSEHPEYTYGRTFVGGLMLNDYYWNPAVWSLRVINNENITDIMSGGLRLPVAIWGYASFSWIGVVFISLMSGLLTGIFVKKTKRILHRTDNIILKSITIILYIHIYSFFIVFYAMKTYNIPAFFLSALYLYEFKLPRKKPSSEKLLRHMPT
jgi:hypothetical protein